ncbi:MAG: peptidoglycan-binding protein [Kiloniellales bacterium]
MLALSRVLTLGLVAFALAVPQSAWSLPLGGSSAPHASKDAIRIAGTRVEDMAPAHRRAYILGIQEELAAHGYHVGPIDGEIGSKTKGAIRQYQRDAGLPVDGIATKELLDHLKFATPKVYARTQRMEADSALVRDIQTELQFRGYYQGALDGVIGPRTREAIILFQTDAGLPATGRVGSGLLSDLRNADPSIRRY